MAGSAGDNRSVMSTSLPLVFDEPRRAKKPPRHLADLTGAQRRLAVEAAGLPGFRAAQVSQRSLARLPDAAEEMTALPAALRQPLADALLPPLVTPVHTM